MKQKSDTNSHRSTTNADWIATIEANCTYWVNHWRNANIHQEVSI